MSKRIYVGGRIESAERGGVVTGANAILDDTKGKKQNVINSETDAELARLDNAKQDVLTFDNAPTEGSNNPVKSGGVYAADAALQQAIEAILQLIPSAATALNQLADKAFVNSTVATDTATFRGTYNVVTDLSLHYNSTHQEIETALLSVVQTADNNDYCFVQIPVSDSSGDIRVTERYKFNGTAWSYEYDLNNSGFTADQWAAINSTITLALVQKLGALPTAAELAQQLALKQNTLTFDTAPVAGSSNPVTSGGLYNVIAAINATIPSGASVDNKLVAESRLTQYVAAIVGALDATFNVTSTDGHVNVRLTQVDGAITSVEVITNDIASASALNTLAGRVTTNEGDIAQLQALYNALQQSAPVIIQPTDTWPVASPSATVIYRVIDRVNTPPQYYSDYMFSANDLTTPVLMAQYNNAMDNEPTADSSNLVKSGGVVKSISDDLMRFYPAELQGKRFLASGDTTTAAGYFITDFIPVSNAAVVINTGAVDTNCLLIVYNASKERQDFFTLIANPYSKDVSGFAYIRVAFRIDYANNVSITMGGVKVFSPLDVVYDELNKAAVFDFNTRPAEEWSVILPDSINKNFKGNGETQSLTGALITDYISVTNHIYKWDVKELNSDESKRLYAIVYNSNKVKLDFYSLLAEYDTYRYIDLTSLSGVAYIRLAFWMEHCDGTLTDTTDNEKLVYSPIFEYINVINVLKEKVSSQDDEIADIRSRVSGHNGFIKINIGQFNEGNYNYGDGGPFPTLSDYNSHRMDWHAAISGINADILFLEEHPTQLVQGRNDMPSYDDFYKQFFPYVHEGGNFIMSKFELLNGSYIQSNEPDQPYRRYATAYVNINGRSVKLVCFHPFSHEYGLLDCDDVISACANDEYVIIGADSNDFQGDYYPKFVNAGYQIGNHGYWGDIITISPQSGSLLVDTIDTFFVKGFQLCDFKAHSDLVATSDHYPVTAFVTTND